MKTFLLTSLLLLASIVGKQATMAATPILESFNIIFDWDPSKESNDAISILYDEEENLYKYAYTIDANATIKIELVTGYEGNMALFIDAKAINGPGQDICYHNENFNPATDEIFIPITTSNVITKYNFEWEWNITAVPICHAENTFESVTLNRITQQHLYFILAKPAAPMATPWASVLDYACEWAEGESSDGEATIALITNFYENSGLKYSDRLGISHYYTNYLDEGVNVFNLTGLLDIWDNVDCRDCSMFLTILSSSIGGSITQTRRLAGRSVFETNPIMPIGYEQLGYDWCPTTWSFHQIAWKDRVYDPTLKLKDGNGHEYIPINVDIYHPYEVDICSGGDCNWQFYTPFILGIDHDPYDSNPTEIR